MNNRKELFVVLATAAVLATMFFSVRAGYSAAKEKARQAQCVSNLSQIGKGFFQYAMSNDDWYPTSSRTSTPKWMNGDSGASFNLLYKQNKNYRFTTFGLPSDEGPFVADPKVFLCPSKDSISVATDGQSLLGHVSYNWCDGLMGGNATISPVCADGADNHRSTGRFVRGDGSVGLASSVGSDDSEGWWNVTNDLWVEGSPNTPAYKFK